jgi:hypothetical protein
MKQAGFSLVELLVCLLLSMLLILILIQHLLSVSRQSQQVHALLQETIELQWVFDVMRARIVHAGFTPCKRLSQLNTIDTRTGQAHLLGLTVLPHQVLIYKMDETAFSLAVPLSAHQLQVKNLSLKPNRAVIIANCTHAEVHQVAGKIGDVITLTKPLVFDYAQEMYLGAWIEEGFIFKPGKGFFFKQQHVDYMAAAEHVQFSLKRVGNSLSAPALPTCRGLSAASMDPADKPWGVDSLTNSQYALVMDWVSKQNKAYQLVANVS